MILSPSELIRWIFSHFGASAQTQCLSASVRNQPILVMEDKWVSCFLNNWEFVVTFVNRLRLIGETYLNWDKSPTSIRIIMARDEGILWRGKMKCFPTSESFRCNFYYLSELSRRDFSESSSAELLSVSSQLCQPRLRNPIISRQRGFCSEGPLNSRSQLIWSFATVFIGTVSYGHQLSATTDYEVISVSTYNI
jgi:hypothetical protein